MYRPRCFIVNEAKSTVPIALAPVALQAELANKIAFATPEGYLDNKTTMMLI